MRYIRKALEKGFSEMYGFGGGVQNHIFRKLAINVYGLGFFFACSGQVSDTLHCIPISITGCTVGGAPLFLRWEIQKIMFRRMLGQWESCMRANYEKTG